MRIGILTLPFNYNYGGLLQSYALQTFIKARGHDVYLIYQPYNHGIKQCIKKFLRIGNFSSDSDFTSFQKKHMKRTHANYSNDDLRNLINYNFDAIIVGSDQVWRFDYTRDNYLRYFLDFCKNWDLIKISFAASFGVADWLANEEQTVVLRNLIREFDAISVREFGGASLLQNHLEYSNAKVLLDPTLLFDAAFYRALYKGNEIINKGKVACYFLDKNEYKYSIAAQLSSHLGKSYFEIGSLNRKSMLYGEMTLYPPISQWIHDFDSANFIITDSFHGAIFSMIFRKPFVVLGNFSRGLDRFETLLKSTGLTETLVDISKPFPEISNINFDLDYTKFDLSIQANMQNAMAFCNETGI